MYWGMDLHGGRLGIGPPISVSQNVEQEAEASRLRDGASVGWEILQVRRPAQTEGWELFYVHS